jgi:hypothetical protein
MVLKPESGNGTNSGLHDSFVKRPLQANDQMSNDRMTQLTTKDGNI